MMFVRTAVIAALLLAPAVPAGAETKPNALHDLHRLYVEVVLLRIHAEMGLMCGVGAPGAVGRRLDRVYAFAREEAERLTLETLQLYGPRSSEDLIRRYLEARTAGYEDGREMHRDVVRVLGRKATAVQVATYLAIRRGRRYGLSGSADGAPAFTQPIVVPVGGSMSDILRTILETDRRLWLESAMSETLSAVATSPTPAVR